jgi:predicted Rossmann fold nucleotide-binding protein DprA/Smf involved in DNA uptake
VSGFAYGVDIVAHQLAMEHNLQTIGGGARFKPNLSENP